MIPFVGLSFSGRTVAERVPVAPGEGALGKPVWGPLALLGDLELRLGLPGMPVPTPLRVQAWLEALAADVAAHPDAFFARSLASDPLGTARTLLAWRDDLVLAGWNGQQVATAGKRLEVLARVEARVRGRPGLADRMRAVLEALELEEGSAGTIYDRLELAEPPEAWPGRWRAIFDRLTALGTPVEHAAAPTIAPVADTDLGRVQAALAGSRSVGELRGDGTFVLLQAETSWELADAVAALLARKAGASTLVVRSGDSRALDLAFQTHGLATQGVADSSDHRATLQLLSLAVQLLHEPRDIRRVLDLLTLPRGPFDNRMGRALARALAEAPGVGGRTWVDAKADAAPEMLDRVKAWLEGPLFDPSAGAPKQSLIDTADRVLAFLNRRLGRASKNGEELHALVFGVAQAHARAFRESLEVENRDVLGREAALQLVRDATDAGCAVPLTLELASRFEIADGPAGVRRSFEQIVWWNAIAGSEWRPKPSPWRKAEVAALESAGVRFADPLRRLSAETDGWRSLVASASSQLVACLPRSTVDGRSEPHPLLVEIGARLSAREYGRVTVSKAQLCGTETRSPAAEALVERVETPIALVAERACLPPARATWKLPPGSIEPAESLSASQLDTMLGCPLRWVLEKRARVRPGSIASIPDDVVVRGKLAHRVVEELQALGALGSRGVTDREVGGLLDRLVAEEAAPLIMPGKHFEWSETRREMMSAIGALSELIERSSLRIVGVETELETEWKGRPLRGRIDLLLQDPSGRELVLDLKWGGRTYRELLRAGLALQLAVYAGARKLQTASAELPHAAYFSLFQGRLYATEPGSYGDIEPLPGPRIAETWARLGPTVELTERLLAEGTIPVTGVATTPDAEVARLPLLDAAGVTFEERTRYLPLVEEHGCHYCGHGSLCGRAWEGIE